MPLSKTNEMNLIVNPDTLLNIEHSGGDGWTILHGDIKIEDETGNKAKRRRLKKRKHKNIFPPIIIWVSALEH